MFMRCHGRIASAAILISLFLSIIATAQPASPGPSNRLTLWYSQPAKICMNEALPVGNGRLGAMIFGIPAAERIILNEDSLWTGNDNPSGNDGTMGAYQVLGELNISLPGHDQADNYRRDLNLADATAHVTYLLNGTNYRREIFASHPAQVIVIRLTADHSASYTGGIEFKDTHHARIIADGNRLIIAGSLS